MQVAEAERHRSDRRKARTQAEDMWGDTAARKFMDVLDELEVEDRAYASALSEMDATFDEADKLLGPL